DGVGVVDRRLLAADEVSAVRGGDPLERIAGQALVGVALVDEAVEVPVASTLTGLDRLRLRPELFPGRRRMAEVVLLQQVRAVVEDSEVAEPRHRDQVATD